MWAQTHAAPPASGSGQSDLGIGVCFPEVDGRRSTTATGRAILADAAAADDAALAQQVLSCAQWRSDYVALLRELTLACADGESSLAIARAGLESMRSRLLVERAGERLRLGDALEALEPELELGTVLFEGAQRPADALRVPFGGEELQGQKLARQLERWVDAGSVEPSFADAIGRVIDHPEWLSLPGRTVALMGAAAEIGPLQPLCAWGADVIAVDLPQPAVWQRVGETARRGAGSVRAPARAGSSPGLDLLRLLPEARSWLAGAARDRELVLGMYAYADGGPHVLLSGAFDALATDALALRPATAVSYLATPTDAFVVAPETVARSHAAYAARRVRRLAQAPVKLASAGRLFAPAYRHGVPVADALVKQQGPNYALAKRLQRWRGVAAEAAGQRVSFNVAPATWTRSVTKNRVLAAAYAGAHHFGVEIFRPDTTRVLMAAMLVHDLHRPPSPRSNPEALFSDGAAHGGLWTAAYEPRSALSVAALAGLPHALRGNGR